MADQMAVRLKETYPGLQVVDTFSPAYGVAVKDTPQAELDRINAAAPDVVWVGLGHPKQDLWVHHHRAALDAPVLAAVGAAFDFHAGMVKEAPEWMKRSGLQWLHRLARDPRRLWRRYLIGNPRFLWLLLREALTDKKKKRRLS
jgi:N-acetylglucosaminyldiphosphoundecaprenol N-acetyl-beta-D-mannosaminyltransferase